MNRMRTWTELWELTDGRHRPPGPLGPGGLLQRRPSSSRSRSRSCSTRSRPGAANLPESGVQPDDAVRQGALRGLRQRDGAVRRHPGHRPHGHVHLCLCEWIADAFQGKELLLEIYSRLLNPTSVALANHIVDLEAGPYAREYLAWNFNSGMAAIDATLSHLLGHHDILVTSRNIYGGAHQLINDWYAKSANLGIAVETFDGYTPRLSGLLGHGRQRDMPTGSDRSDRRTSTWNRPAIRTAMCSTCPASAARPTTQACA